MPGRGIKTNAPNAKYANESIANRLCQPDNNADSTRIYPTIRVPNEVLSHAFRFLPDLKAKLVAAQTCARWRRVALGDPRIWSQINVHCHTTPKRRRECGTWGCDCYYEDYDECPASSGSRKYSPTSNFHQLPFLLERSGQVPVTLSISLEGHILAPTWADSPTPELSMRDAIATSSELLDLVDKHKLHPLTELFIRLEHASSRISSIVLVVQTCPTWFNFLLHLPALPHLLILDVTARYIVHTAFIERLRWFNEQAGRADAYQHSVLPALRKSAGRFTLRTRQATSRRGPSSAGSLVWFHITIALHLSDQRPHVWNSNAATTILILVVTPLTLAPTSARVAATRRYISASVTLFELAHLLVLILV
ncbi:hypothetical protein BKA62DRAFT_758505 [Auriculariales sp. MPI-PUGE-AT-0066]|nr:hypothetical protein BKA62DRAFT_758505 [Auriculariales sp. MPI-PUGE-AT-0066]